MVQFTARQRRNCCTLQYCHAPAERRRKVPCRSTRLVTLAVENHALPRVAKPFRERAKGQQTDFEDFKKVGTQVRRAINLLISIVVYVYREAPPRPDPFPLEQGNLCTASDERRSKPPKYKPTLQTGACWDDARRPPKRDASGVSFTTRIAMCRDRHSCDSRIRARCRHWRQASSRRRA